MKFAADVPEEEEGESEEKPQLCLWGLIRESDSADRVPGIKCVLASEGRVGFSRHPLHRYQNHLEFAFLTNALLLHDHFPGTPTDAGLLERKT